MSSTESGAVYITWDYDTFLLSKYTNDSSEGAVAEGITLKLKSEDVRLLCVTPAHLVLVILYQPPDQSPVIPGTECFRMYASSLPDRIAEDSTRVHYGIRLEPPLGVSPGATLRLVARPTEILRSLLESCPAAPPLSATGDIVLRQNLREAKKEQAIPTKKEAVPGPNGWFI